MEEHKPEIDPPREYHVDIALIELLDRLLGLKFIYRDRCHTRMNKPSRTS